MSIKQTNPLFNNKATLKFNRIPNIDFYAKAYSLPGISIPVLERSTITTPVRYAGSVLTYDQTFSIIFMMDEDLSAYTEIYDWMVGIGSPDNREQYAQLLKDSGMDDIFSDATLYINNSHGKPNVKVTFEDCYPIGLAGLEFNVPSDSPTELQGDATFAYTKFTLKKI